LRERGKFFKEKSSLSLKLPISLKTLFIFIVACGASDNKLKRFWKRKMGHGEESNNLLAKRFCCLPHYVYL
jgi:hypothetical protein